LKIGFVLDDSLDSSDGVQQYVLALGGWLTKQGHKVHYLVGETKRTDLPNVHSLSRNLKVRFNGNRMSMPRPVARQTLKDLLQAEQFDILHIQMPYSPWLAGRIIETAPATTAVVGTFHIMPYGDMQVWGARLLSWYTRKTTARLRQIWSVSEPAQSFAKELGMASTVLPNVVDLSRFSQSKPLKTGKGDFKIVFLGRLVERKGCLELLQALELMVKTTDNVHLTICGTGPQAPMLENWVKEHALGGYVTFTGYIAEAAKAGYLASADLAIFPSLGGESFGIVLLEAMAAGAGVVIGGNNPGYASVLGSIPRTLINPRDPVSFARQLKRLHEDPKLRKELHLQQQKLVKQYDISVIGKKLVSYYQHLIEEIS
jgi:phosphatidylinositol alpha-mannosyltransferase